MLNSTPLTVGALGIQPARDHQRFQRNAAVDDIPLRFRELVDRVVDVLAEDRDRDQSPRPFVYHSKDRSKLVA